MMCLEDIRIYTGSGKKIPTSSVELLVLSALVCCRGYKRARDGEGHKSLVKELNGVESS
jgi:hypothetical protein